MSTSVRETISSRTRTSVTSLTAFLTITTVIAGLAAQDTGTRRSASDGVYTEDQAKRGAAAYSQSCSPCHGGSLAGEQGAPALVGDAFLGHWTDQTVNDLFENIRTGMPMDNPGSLTDNAFVDVVAYILQRNNYPAGKDELKSDKEALMNLILVKK